MGERKTKIPKVIVGSPTVTGQLDKAIIKRIIDRNRGQIRYCYEKELNRKKKLHGRIVVNFTISVTGRVLQSKIKESTMKDANVENCLKGKIKHWIFPEPTGGGMVRVTYPFIFKSN